MKAEIEADAQAVEHKTARLRSLRLAKEAAQHRAWPNATPDDGVALINAEHGKVEAAKAAAMEHCGRLLAQAKETVPHGRWNAWVRANCAFSVRTAQLYMRL